MKLAEIKNSIVVNVIEVDPLDIPDWCADWPLAELAEIGGSFDGVEFHPRPEPAVDLDALRAEASLTFAQLLIGLVTEGWITAEEGRAWRDRVALPAPVAALIASLPQDQQFAAETRALAPSVVLRLDPLVVALGVVKGVTPEQLDAFFLTYKQV